MLTSKKGELQTHGTTHYKQEVPWRTKEKELSQTNLKNQEVGKVEAMISIPDLCYQIGV